MSTPVALPERVAAIATHLGEGWAVAPRGPHRVDLLGPDGMRLEVTEDPWRRAQRNTLTVTARFDGGLAAHLPYRAETPTARMATAREPALLAREITRRVLPRYQALLRTARALQADHDAAERVRDQLVASLAAILGPTAAAGSSPRGGRRRITCRRRPAVDVQMDVATGPHPIELTVEVPKRLAPQLCQLLRDLADAQPESVACARCAEPSYPDEIDHTSGCCHRCAATAPDTT